MKEEKTKVTGAVGLAVALAAWGLCPALAANPDCPNLEEVIIASKCHLDVGFTSTVPALIDKYRTHDMDSALALFEADRGKPEALRARWTFPAWAMSVILDGHCTPDRRMKIEEAIRSHRLTWHAFPFTIETEASDLEEMVRLFGYGSEMSRNFGLDLPRHAKQTDVPEQGWALATVLANAGVKFLHIGINEGCKRPEDLAKIPPLCWWEGPDGSRILLGYCSNYGEIRRGPFKPPKGWKHKTYLAYYMRGDNQGPISPKDAERVLNEVRTALPGVKVRFGDPAEFADAIAAEEKANPTLPVVRGDMPDTWIHGQMTAPIETALHRHAKSELITLGILDTTLRALGVQTKPVAKTLDRAYRKSGLYSEHTWGLSCGRERGRFHDPDWRERYERGDFKYIDSAFEYHKDYARDAHRMAKDGIDERMKLLAQSVAADGPRVVVFNPLPYARDAEVEVEMPEGFELPGGVREGGKVRFLAKGVPAGGYKTFAAVETASVQQQGGSTLPDVLKTRHFTVKFDLEKGGIASLVENATGRELVKQGGHALGQFLHERFSLNEVKNFVFTYNRGPQRRLTSDFGKAGLPGPDKIPYAAMSPKKWTAKLTRNALGEVVTLTAASADLPLWSLGKPGLWRYEPDYVPTEPEVFANLYNNMWNTNFPFWIPGSWTALLRIYPVAEGADEEQAVFTPAWEIRQSCVAAFAAAKTASVQQQGGGIAVSRKGVRVTAFCPNPDGRGIVLRVWEQAGVSGALTVTLPKGMKVDQVQPVNLRGEIADEPIAVKDGKFSFELGAWAPKSFILFDGTEKGAAAYRFYRFAVDLTAGDAVQISELKLFSEAQDITRTCSAVRYEEGGRSPRTARRCHRLSDGDCRRPPPHLVRGERHENPRTCPQREIAVHFFHVFSQTPLSQGAIFDILLASPPKQLTKWSLTTLHSRWREKFQE